MTNATITKYLEQAEYTNQWGRKINVFIVGDYTPLIDNSTGEIIKRSLIRLITASPQSNFAVANKNLRLIEE